MNLPTPKNELRKPSFFKVMLAETLKSKKLMIPDKYVAYHRDLFLDEAILILPNGQSWKVGLTKTPKNIIFDKKWDEFVEHCSIREKHFLVFEFKCLSTFEVKILDLSGCEIEYPTSTRIDGMATNSHRDAAGTKRSPVSNRRMTRGSCSKRPAEQNLESKIRKVETTPSLKINDNQRADKQKKKIRVENSKRNHSGDKGVAEEIGVAEIGFRSPYPESITGIKLSRTFKSEKPHFKVLLREYNFNGNATYFPARFAKKYMENAAEFVKLVVKDGREWSLRISRKKNGRLSFSSGWTAFYKENELKKGDICIFELVKENEFLVSFIPS